MKLKETPSNISQKPSTPIEKISGWFQRRIEAFHKWNDISQNNITPLVDGWEKNPAYKRKLDATMAQMRANRKHFK